MLQFTIIDVSVGPLGIVASPKGLTHLHMMRPSGVAPDRRMAKLHPDAMRNDDLLPDLQVELGLYFSGRPVCFSVPVDLTSCSEFQRRVLRACARIDYGRTTTYGELARRVGCPAGARAVGGALARNPVPLVIPCHRVLAGDRTLGGFSAEQGVGLKRFLLDLEARGLPCTPLPGTPFCPARSRVRTRGRAGLT